MVSRYSDMLIAHMYYAMLSFSISVIEHGAYSLMRATRINQINGKNKYRSLIFDEVPVRKGTEHQRESNSGTRVGGRSIWGKRESVGLKDEESGMWKQRRNILGRRSSIREGPEGGNFWAAARSWKMVDEAHTLWGWDRWSRWVSMPWQGVCAALSVCGSNVIWFIF